MIKIQAIQLSPPIATKVANLHPEELFRGECLIGSSPNCHLVIDDSEVCGIHGKIFCYQQQYYFTDLASGQGSLINDDVAQINQNYLLKMGDLLRLGDSVLLVEAVVLGSEAFNAPELNSKQRYQEESFYNDRTHQTANSNQNADSNPSFGVRAILHNLSPENILIPRELVKAESAIGPSPSESNSLDKTFNRVCFSQSQKEITCDDDETILELAEREGVPIGSGCRAGRCGMCKQRVTEGTVRYDLDPKALSQDDRASGLILPCIAYPEGRVVLNL